MLAAKKSKGDFKMTINEIKNRISMALKDPVLQQGFEIICKENKGLKEKLILADYHTAELKHEIWNLKKKMKNLKHKLKK